MSAQVTSLGLHGTSYGTVFSCGCVCWYSKHVAHCFTVFLMSALIFTKYIDSLGKFHFLFLHHFCATAPVFVSEIQKVLLFFCLSWQCHQLLLAHAWLANNSACFVLLNLFCVASAVLCMILAFAGLHPVRLPPVCLLWMSILLYHWCADGMYIYIHSRDSMVPGFCIIVLG